MAFYTRLFLLCLLVACRSVAATAQVYELGYLVLNGGDTLRGEIENQFWLEPPTTVRFRSDANSRVRNLPARQLRSIQLASGRLLRRELLPIDYQATTTIGELPQGLSIRQQEDSVLADVLLEGEAVLLGISWNRVRHFFVRRPGKPYLEMAARKYLANQGGSSRIIDGNNYRNQLLVYFGDCEPAATAASRAAFTEDGLLRVVQLFNQQCAGTRQAGRRIEANDKKKRRMKAEFGPIVGGRYNSLRLRGEEYGNSQFSTGNGNLVGLQLDGRLHLQGGLYFDVLAESRRLGIHTALQYANYGHRQGRTVAAPNGQAAQTGALDWRGGQLTVQAGLRTFIPLGSVYRLIGGAGAELSVMREQADLLRYGNPSTPQPNFVGRLDGSLLPYVEVGLQRGRVTVAGFARSYGRHDIADWVAPTIARPGQQEYYPYLYSGHRYSLALSLSYRLTRDADTRP